MTKIKINTILYLILCLIIIQLFIPIASGAAGGDANIDEDLSVTANPAQQGAGGPITISIAATFYGGCCYPLYAYNVQPELILPKGVEVMDKLSPNKISKFEATAGGGAVLAKFSCSVKSFIPGDYEIKFKVLTENCGNAEGKVNIEFTEGCVISTPSIFPKQPSTDHSTSVTISAYSPIDGVDINDVTLYYVKMDSEIASLKPENEKLNWGSNSKEGTAVPFKLSEYEENQWIGDIPIIKDESFLIFWVVAEDNFGNTTTSPANTFEVKDLNKIHFQHSMLIWGVLIASMIGIIVIAFIWKFAGRIPSIRSMSKGFILIGSGNMDLKTKTTDSPYMRKMNISRNVVLLALFIIAILLLIFAILSNQYELLRENVGG